LHGGRELGYWISISNALRTHPAAKKHRNVCHTGKDTGTPCPPRGGVGREYADGAMCVCVCVCVCVCGTMVSMR
jgi:hypothetical protein